MDKPEIIATNVFQEELKKSQYTVTAVPAHAHTGTDSELVNYPNLTNRSRFILYRALSNTTSNAVANTVGGDVALPFGGNFIQIGATVDTAGTTGSETINFLLNGTVIGTIVTIASASKTSRPVTTLQQFTTKNFKVGDILTFNVTAVHTIPALGLTLFLRVTETTP